MSSSIPHDRSSRASWEDALRFPPGSRGWCVAEACRLEATAEKPGNVHPGASFPDLDHAELVAAGRAIAPAIEAAPSRPLGRTILAAVTASRRVTRSNANLGIILAIAPLASVPDAEDGRPFRTDDVAAVLAGLTPEDAADAWEAIAVAAPGGMGRRGRWDLAGPPPDDLLAAMAAAAPHDRIARLWTEGWGPLEDGLVADLLTELATGLPLDECIVRGFLRQLAREPDTLIARRHGADVAAEVSRQAAAVIGHAGASWRDAAAAFDRSLRRPRRINPGTTADLCATALYILLRDGRLRPAALAPQGVAPASPPFDFLTTPPGEHGMERFSVRLRKAVHVFCSGHFITLTDTVCEPVHGHNWTVAVEVDGTPDAHGMVVDFILLRDTLSAIVARLDHRMLLPTRNRHLEVSESIGPGGLPEVTVRFERRRWVFPADECVLLPLGNTTAEWIAAWIGDELKVALAAAGAAFPSRIVVAVDECAGQEGVWERSSS